MHANVHVCTSVMLNNAANRPRTSLSGLLDPGIVVLPARRPGDIRGVASGFPGCLDHIHPSKYQNLDSFSITSLVIDFSLSSILLISSTAMQIHSKRDSRRSVKSDLFIQSTI